VVVRNRLEQLRKRQRDEALQAQEELLAGVSRLAQQGTHRPVAEAAAEDIELYDRSMSPPLIDSAIVANQERGSIVSAKDDLRELVSTLHL
jgi:hypothetical protein